MVTKTVPQLKQGDIVSYYGGRFLVTADAQVVQSSKYDYADGWKAPEFVGPSACATAPSVCLSGSVQGYFWPGSEWTFQGNHHAVKTIEA